MTEALSNITVATDIFYVHVARKCIKYDTRKHWSFIALLLLVLQLFMFFYTAFLLVLFKQRMHILLLHVTVMCKHPVTTEGKMFKDWKRNFFYVVCLIIINFVWWWYMFSLKHIVTHQMEMSLCATWPHQVFTIGPSGTRLLMWAATGNHGRQWTYANVIVSSTVPFRVTFEAQVGGDMWTDIALDDISYTAECIVGGKDLKVFRLLCPSI